MQALNKIKSILCRPVRVVVLATQLSIAFLILSYCALRGDLDDLTVIEQMRIDVLNKTVT